MTIQAIRDLLRRRPFEPFRLVLSSGDRYDVLHPEAALVLRGGVYIALPSGGLDERLPDRAAWCSALHIANVETLAPAS